MKDAIAEAIAARLGDVADLAWRLKQGIEARAPAGPFPLIRLGLDADAMALALEAHVERIRPAPARRPDSPP